MRWLRKFLRLTHGDRRLLLNAAILLVAIRLGLRLVPVKTLRYLLARTQATTELQEADQVYVDRVPWAVTLVSRYLPAPTSCLTRALAAQALLSRRGYQSHLRIGVAKGEDGQLEAHAWVESKGRVVIGGLKELSRYIPLRALEEEGYEQHCWHLSPQ
jgi:Transglutaminase-like superfamily